MFTFLNRVSTKRMFWLALAVLASIVFLSGIIKVPQIVGQAMGYTGNTDVWAIDDSYTNPPSSTIYTLLSSYGETGRRAVIFIHLIFDYVFPIVYFLLLTISQTLLSEKLFRVVNSWRWLVLLPLIGVLSDFLENAGIITMCLAYPTQLTLVSRFTSILTILKFTFILLSLLLLLIEGSVLLIRWLINLTHQKSFS